MLSAYSVQYYNASCYQQWNNFIANAKNATFLFHRDFMEYHQDRFEDASVLVFKQDKLVAILPANKIGTTVFSHLGLTYGGLIYSAKLKFQTVLQIFQKVLQFFYTEGFEQLELKLLPSIYAKGPNQEQDYIMFLLQAKLVRRDMLSVISLSENLPFSKDRKDGVKRALKHHLVIKNDNNFTDFWQTILVPNLQQKYGVKPVHSAEEITLLHNRFPDNIKQFNVYFNEKLVAGTTVFISNRVAHSQYISATTDKNKLGSLDFLHHVLITETFKNKPYFDFGISNENKGKQVNAGLVYWKEGFGARAIAQDFYSIPTANYNHLTNVML
ncbi:GNAT family N-acetyltransferase [Bizionia sediminis]|uniref:GNAT family N-acetyltransferase n=1 Tax=Bizionia sediminis TaxID=1737064 RepID=A0ABW5KUB1_9FLAO